mmetsp:Transcript_120632/g.327341  ORF Transcript_120632/g.327341 Transcript_120632/m.327341 type:complete len:255 (+) Transcript_120632:864-1628(+)
MRHLELRGHHVHHAVRLPAVLRAERPGGARQGAPGDADAQRGGLEVHLRGREGAGARPRLQGPAGAPLRRAGPAAPVDLAEGPEGDGGAATGELCRQVASLSEQGQVCQGCAARHRGSADRSADQEFARDVHRPRRQQRWPAVDVGAEGRPAPRRPERAAWRPAGHHGQYRRGRLWRHRLHRVHRRHAIAEAVHPGRRVLGRVPRVRCQRRREDLRRGAQGGAQQRGHRRRGEPSDDPRDPQAGGQGRRRCHRF